MLLIPNPLASNALARPEHPALICEAGTLTAQELYARAARAASVLGHEGIEAGQLVALVGPPARAWIVGWHAIGLLGATAAPLAYDAPADELRAQLDQLAAFAQSRGLPKPLVLRSEGLAAEEMLAQWNAGSRLMLGGLDNAQAAPAPERFWPLSEPRVVIFTSGTEGQPRPVSLRTSQLVFSAFGAAMRLGHLLDDRWLCCLPLYHVAGLSILMRCAWLGTTVLLHERFDPTRVARALDQGEASLASLVPSMMRRVLDARAERPFPPSLRAILLGGESTPADLIERLRIINAPVSLSWGMSESASQVATRFPGDLEEFEHSGPPQAFARVYVEEGQRLAVTGPLVAEGQLTSSDIGHVDETGRVHVHGRADDMIISGGKLIAPEPIEAVLRAHSQVEEVVVVARPDTRWGQRPVALVQSALPSQPHLACELLAFCAKRLAGYKIPDDIIFVEELPRSRNGKLSRTALAARWIGTSGLQNERPQEPAARAQHLPPARRLAELREWLAEDLQAIEAEIGVVVGAGGSIAKRSAHHLLTRPGKRVRPICVLLGARLARPQIDASHAHAARDLGLAAELVHAATLLHDDVIDLGTERRGAPTARMLYGNTASVLGGDQLLTMALRRIRKADPSDMLDRVLAVIDLMVEAEALQLEQQQKLDPSPAIYNRIISGKTASLFRWSLEAGAALAGLGSGAVELAGAAGHHLGLAFQLVDDVLDLQGDPAVIGKDSLADLRQGKVTWPFLLAAQADAAIVPQLRAFADGSNLELGHALLAKVVACGAVEATRQRADDEVAAAKAALAKLPPGRACDALTAVADYVVARVH